ncbi:MAG: nucleoside deaminase [Saprospiraceae bacterium]|nr:nucleoside deaminase [Saprospiraceae bacterium]
MMVTLHFMNDHHFLRAAIEMARQGMRNNEGGPFGAVIVKDGVIVGSGNNRVTSTNDPTAHAEVVAIREACKHLNNFQLDGCVLYTSCEPCPMCFGAIYWARPDRIVYACSKADAAAIGFDDDFIYKELDLPLPARKIPANQALQEEGREVFKEWTDKSNKTAY